MFKLSLQDIFFFILLITLSVGFFYVISPFLIDIFLTIVLVMLFKSPFLFFKKKYKGRKALAAFTTLFLVLIIILIPVVFIGIMVTQEVTNNYFLVRDNWTEIEATIVEILNPDKAKSLPYVGQYFADFDWNILTEKINEAITFAAKFSLQFAQSTFMNFGYILMHFFIILFLMYYLLMDGDRLIARIQYLIPLNDDDEKELFDKLEKITDAIILNTFMIGAIEGVYGGLLFYFLGIGSPVFWGVIMAFLSIIPLVGANSILLPMAIIQFILGNVWTGVILLVLGVGAITINQNIVRNRLDGNRSEMHPAIIFLSSMGGLIWLGLVGFLAGPMLTGMFLVIWNQFGKRYQEKLEKFNHS